MICTDVVKYNQIISKHIVEKKKLMSGEPNCRITPRVFRKLDGQYYIIYHVGIRNVAAETKHPSNIKENIKSKWIFVCSVQTWRWLSISNCHHFLNFDGILWLTNVNQISQYPIFDGKFVSKNFSFKLRYLHFCQSMFSFDCDCEWLNHHSSQFNLSIWLLVVIAIVIRLIFVMSCYVHLVHFAKSKQIGGSISIKIELVS